MGNVGSETDVRTENTEAEEVVGTVVSVAAVRHTAVLVLRLRVRVLSLPIFEYLP